MTTSGDALESLYRTAAGVRTTGFTADQARPFYARYVEFVSAFAPAPGPLLDVGCGSGWSTFVFAERGFESTGIDLNPNQFEPSPMPGLALALGSGTAIPFAVTCANQTLEHVPDPAKMLDEMIRVTRPGGVVVVVGPNLLGLMNYAYALGRHVWRNRPRATIFVRRPGMPRHPTGNTVPELIGGSIATLSRLLQKAVDPRPRFSMRTPDLTPPFHADNDACYRCCPQDLAKFFRQRGCVVLRDTALGRPRWTRALAGGTWVAARVPG
jgi:SAM-dependent methyltransferase